MASSLESSSIEGPATRMVLDVRPPRVLIVSNRLPVSVSLEGGTITVSPSAGGLATGLRRVHSSSRRWIGWSGLGTGISRSAQLEIDARLAEAGTSGVPLSDAEIAGYYRRFASGVLWPLLHDRMPEAADGADWRTYRTVNARFADAVLREWRPGDRVWIHDYHLMLLPRLLRLRRPEIRTAFFLHTPFPRPESLTSLPAAADLIDGVLGADAVGFQTQADLRRFALAVRIVTGRHSESAAGSGLADDLGRPVCLHASSMSVDFASFASRAEDSRVRRRAESLRAGEGPLFLGVDRLDPTKGILQRLEAFGRMLEARPELRGRARLLQLAVPSRDAISSYRALRHQVEALVARLNARFGAGSWRPIDYAYGSVDELELTALYRAADVMLVTPLRDGMNLVAKEFVASRSDESGVLVLSKEAGAATELTAALLVDPGDVDGLGLAYIAALEMGPAERRVRMRRLRARVEGHDVHRWARECLHQLDEAGRLARHAAS